jgi:hypothetical protein
LSPGAGKPACPVLRGLGSQQWAPGYPTEGGKRIPRQEYLVKADEVLGAGGLIAAMWEDVKKVRYPKKVRDLAQMEAKAVELQLYDPLNIHGLLQTPEYARGLLLMRRPAYTEEEVERFIAARVARKAVFERDPAPEISFVLEEWTLRRPLGGRAVLRRQLERLLEAGQLRNVELQVMPMDREEHAGLAGGEVRGRLGGGPFASGGHRQAGLRAEAVPYPGTAVRHHPGAGSHST